MGVKVTFDPINYEIRVTAAPSAGVVELDFKVDVYSDGKEDWRATDDLARHVFPIRAIGGDPLSDSLNLDAVYFIAAPWQFLPFDADHTLSVIGNVFRDVGSTLPLVKPRAGRSILSTFLTTFSAGGSGSLTASGVATSVWAQILESGQSATALLRMIASTLLGDGAVPLFPGPFTSKSIDGSKVRVAGTVAVDGTRTVTTRDGT